MKKEIKTQYGIQIVKPWSKEMYAHNEMVAEAVRILVTQRWENALNAFEEELGEEFMSDTEWSVLATAEMKEIQRAITCYGFGYGYDVAKVSERVIQELEDAPLYRLNEIAEELELDLKVGFVGFS
jgi:sugar phosphate isomerase/epimerase